jgi:hypothetical protein
MEVHTLGSWESMVRDLSGDGMFGGSFQWRLLLQRLPAIVLGIRIGVGMPSAVMRRSLRSSYGIGASGEICLQRRPATLCCR